MIMFILAIAAFIVILVYCICVEGFEIAHILVALLAAFIGFVVGFFICIAANAIHNSIPIEKCRVEEIEKTELIALKDNYLVSGSAFLFSSTINEELTYTYMYDTPMGITTKTIDADNVYIEYINEDEVPYIQKWSIEHRNKIIAWLFAIGKYKYTIHLPEGSIIENTFEINLE